MKHDEMLKFNLYPSDQKNVAEAVRVIIGKALPDGDMKEVINYFLDDVERMIKVMKEIEDGNHVLAIKARKVENVPV